VAAWRRVDEDGRVFCTWICARSAPTARTDQSLRVPERDEDLARALCAEQARRGVQ
jgi:hypothetical protein